MTTFNPDHWLLCPLCSSTDLRIVDWADDDGEYDAIECAECKCAAPADRWNIRNGVEHFPGRKAS